MDKQNFSLNWLKTMKNYVLRLTVVGLIKMDEVGLEQRLIILTNRFAILMDKKNDQMFNVFTSTKINQQETEKVIYFQIDRGKTNEDTFEVNTLL